MRCPKCGSENIFCQPSTETITTEKTKGFGWFKACLGWLIAGPWGILCGLCGMGKEKTKTTTKSTVIHICQNCGNRF